VHALAFWYKKKEEDEGQLKAFIKEAHLTHIESRPQPEKVPEVGAEGLRRDDLMSIAQNIVSESGGKQFLKSNVCWQVREDSSVQGA
jgi:hypothetical protein